MPAREQRPANPRDHVLYKAGTPANRANKPFLDADLRLVGQKLMLASDQSAPGRCHGCGFMVRLAGPLATQFGVCANEFANDDGRVVSFDHGCGAHSEAQLRKKQLPPPLPDHVFDTISRDDLETF